MGTEHGSAAHAGPDEGDRFLLVGAELITFKLRGEAYSAFAPPGDFESLLEEVGERVSMRTPPPLPAGPPDAETVSKIVAAGKRHHLHIPPPPDAHG